MDKTRNQLNINKMLRSQILQALADIAFVLRQRLDEGLMT
jgi:hypothetical protein